MPSNGTPYILLYLRERFPLHIYGAALCGAFASSVGVLSTAAGHVPDVSPMVCGLVAFVMTFLLIRVVDDVVDASADADAGRVASGSVTSHRVTLVCMAVVAAVFIVYMGFVTSTISYSVLIVALVSAQPVLKFLLGSPTRALTSGSVTKDFIYGLFHEGTHFLVCLYVYVSWRAASHVGVSLGLMLGTTFLLWSLFLFWKYSRAISRTNWQPYNLRWPQLRIALVLLVITSCLSQLLISHDLRFPSIYPLFLCLIGLAATIALFRTEPREHAARHRFSMFFVVANLCCLMLTTSMKAFS